MTQASTWGDYLSGSGDQVKDGGYNGIILEEKIYTNAQGQPKKTDDGKFRVVVVVGVRDADGHVKKLKRHLTVSFGMDTRSGNYSNFAEYIAAVHGVPCGDPQQKQFGPGSAVKKPVRVMVRNGGGYSNIESFLPALPQASPVQPPAPAQQPAQTAQQQVHAAAQNWQAQQQAQSYAPAAPPARTAPYGMDSFGEGEIPY